MAWSGLCLFVRLADTSILLLLQPLWVHETFSFLETDEHIPTDLVPIRILEKVMKTIISSQDPVWILETMRKTIIEICTDLVHIQVLDTMTKKMTKEDLDFVQVQILETMTKMMIQGSVLWSSNQSLWAADMIHSLWQLSPSRRYELSPSRRYVLSPSRRYELSPSSRYELSPSSSRYNCLTTTYF